MEQDLSVNRIVIVSELLFFIQNKFGSISSFSLQNFLFFFITNMNFMLVNAFYLMLLKNSNVMIRKLVDESKDRRIIERS